MPIWPVIIFLIAAVICFFVGYGPWKAPARGLVRVLFYIFILSAIVMFIFFNVFPPATNSTRAAPPYTPVGR
jgi:uncharacterized membrane protein YtjA (UPF0391 family)